MIKGEEHILGNKIKEQWNGKRFGYLRSASWVVYWTRNEDSPLPINHNGLSIIGDSTLNQLEPQEPNQAQEQAQLGNWVGFHFQPLLSLSLYINQKATQSRKLILNVQGENEQQLV